MDYYVVTPSGLYGPADFAQLAQWALEGRIAPHTELEEERTGRRVPASTLSGIRFTTFQQTPSATGSIAISPYSPPSQNLPSMKPIPPGVVSNYRRPGWQPPLFLYDESRGRRELRYAFLLALAAPIGAIFLAYALLLPLGGMYGGFTAWKRGRKLGILAMAVSLVSLLASVAIRIYASLNLG